MKHGGDIYRNTVKLDFSVNLNPLGPPAEVLVAVSKSLKRAERYPDLYQTEVRQVTAECLGIDSDCVYMGSGASELIMAAVRAVKPVKALLFEPGFSGYRHALDGSGCETVRHVLREDKNFTITREDLAAIGKDIDIIFLCDPSNPSGRNIDIELLKEILDTAKRNNTAVVLDESFYLMSDGAHPDSTDIINADLSKPLPDGRSPYARKPFIDRGSVLLGKYDNLFIIRSLTKILSIPGIRAGYALSNPANIRNLIAQLPEWNLSVTGEEAIKAGIRIITETDYVNRSISLIKKERKWLSRMLRELGLDTYTSNSSFILFRGPDNLYEELLMEGILIRECSDYHGLDKGYYRIAVKSHPDNEILIHAVKRYRMREPDTYRKREMFDSDTGFQRKNE